MKISRNILAVTVFILIVTLMCTGATATSVPGTHTTSGETPSYRVGYMENTADMGIDGYNTVRSAFTNAYNGFAGNNYTGKPVSHVTSLNGYYSQNFADDSGRKASVYVGKDNNAYSVNYPVYDYYEKLGYGTAGYPTSNAYNVNGSYYQNFTNGYVKTNTDGTTSDFYNGKSVDNTGAEVTTANTAGNNTAGTSNITGTNNTAGNTGTAYAGNAGTAKLTTSETATNNAVGGVGADATGVAGSLKSTNASDPIMSTIGLVALGLLLIIVVSISSAHEPSRRRF